MTMTDAFACPAPGCDVFPYDTAESLAAHLMSAHGPGAPAPTPKPVRLVATETHRSFSPAGTRSPFVAAPATPTAKAPGSPATEKQVAFLRVLLERHPDVTPVDFDTLTKAAASKLIEALKDRPRPTVSAPEPARTDPPEGFHIYDGTVYKVQVSKTGNSYAKMLVLPDDPESKENGDWEYMGKRPFKFLSDATVATLEMAQAFGLRTTHCMCCGHHLEVKESVERGIGPVCFAKYF